MFIDTYLISLTDTLKISEINIPVFNCRERTDKIALFILIL